MVRFALLAVILLSSIGCIGKPRHGREMTIAYISGYNRGYREGSAEVLKGIFPFSEDVHKPTPAEDIE